MKKQSILFSAIAILALSLGSCKKESSNVENTSTDTIVTAEPSMTAEPDTVQAPPVNDSNASGTTSGEMEQVP